MKQSHSKNTRLKTGIAMIVFLALGANVSLYAQDVSPNATRADHATSSLLSNLDLTHTSARYALPKNLTEASGLMVASPTSVYTHNDEIAIVHELDINDGRLVRTLTIGAPALRGDFEAVTTDGDTLSLITSDGLIYQTNTSDTHAPDMFSIHNSGLRDTCEIEGAAADADGGILLLCKRHLVDKARDRIVIYRWDKSAPLAGAKVFLSIALDNIKRASAQNFKKPSGLARVPSSGHLVLLDADKGAVLELSPEYTIIGYARLPGGDHPQAEGIAIMPSGNLVVVDEGGKKAGRLSVYSHTGRAD